MTLSKNCLVCGKLFSKTATQSINTWNTSVKYCSRGCQIIGVAKVAGPRITALNISRIGQLKTGSQRWYEKNKERLSAEYKIKYQQHKQEIQARIKERLKLETPEQREKRLAYHSEYRKQHRDGFREYNQTVDSKFQQYHHSAKRRDYEFSLSFEDFISFFHGSCTYCGSLDARGIDRVDNVIGYVKENCVSCCEICNRMKRHYSKDQFLNHVIKIYNFNKKL